jgi:hypothetical protein
MMNGTGRRKLIALAVSTVVVAALAGCTAGCSSNAKPPRSSLDMVAVCQCPGPDFLDAWSGFVEEVFG